MRTVATRGTTKGLTLLSGLMVLCLSGCGGSEAAPDAAPPPKLAVQGPAVPAAAAPGQAAQPQASPDARLHQPFEEATLQDPPAEDQKLPAQTKAGKSVGKLYLAVVAEWAKIRFTTPAGKKLVYTATIATDLGKVQLELWPDNAPNHVRNFIALARAGYYDGLEFDRVVSREFDDNKGHVFEYVEAGCPLGTGESNYGSIGYWMKPEFSGTVRHDEGTVGAWHGEEVETAACKFYINLSKAEWMDGNFTLFGKVTQGLDVVRAIRRRPVCDDETRDRPVTPVVMRSVVIDCREQ